MARQFVISSEPDAVSGQSDLPWRDELNAQQLDAVLSGDGASLVVAGAGTGKTRTLVYRLALLVHRGIPPEQLYISYPMIQSRRFDGEYFSSPDRFLMDVPPALLEPGTLVEAH